MTNVVPVVACSVIKDNKVLFIKRSNPPFLGLLSLPGGKIEFGETVERAAIRELEEETGVRSVFENHLATIPEHIVEEGSVRGHFMIQLCRLRYIAELPKRELEPHWVTLDELDARKSEITPSDYHMIKRIVLPDNRKSHYSKLEKTANGYVQREFREL